MRALFTTLPGYGNLYPLVPLATALRLAGHEVAFACARSYTQAVEAVGFDCVPAGYDWTLAERDRVFAEIRRQRGRDAEAFAPLNDVFADFLTPRIVPDLLRIARSWSPDIVVRDPLEFGGSVAAEVLGLPHAACGPLFALWDGAWHDRPGEVAPPSFDEVRESYGLPADSSLAMLHRHLYLALMPPAFLGPELRVPATAHFIRPVSYHGCDAAPPAWLGRLPDRPTVHASLGTVFHRTPGIFAAILEALRDEPINLVLAVGRDQEPEQFGPQPPNVYIERYIPHSQILPRCDLAIVHGGFGSVMACMSEGLPMLVIPVAGDQPANAARCAALGVARVVPPESRNAERIRAEVRAMLSDPGYRQRSGRTRGEITRLPGVERAVELVERLVQNSSVHEDWRAPISLCPG
jgi:MGT family glycosyltransferase